MTIRVYINGQYIPHEYECDSWHEREGLLYIMKEKKVIALYNTCDWNLVKEITE